MVSPHVSYLFLSCLSSFFFSLHPVGHGSSAQHYPPRRLPQPPLATPDTGTQRKNGSDDNKAAIMIDRALAKKRRGCHHPAAVDPSPLAGAPRRLLIHSPASISNSFTTTEYSSQPVGKPYCSWFWEPFNFEQLCCSGQYN